MLLLIKLFYIFFKIGLFAFGGGYVILPMIYQDIQTFGIMNPNEFSDIVALSQMTPGPIAVNAATFVGFRVAGILGAAFATIGVITPPFIIILTIMAFLSKFKSSPVIQAILAGIRPATAGMIASAVIFFSKTSIFNEGFFSTKMFADPLKYISIPAVAIFALTIIGAKKFKIGPIALTLLAGVVGAFIM